MAFLKRLSKIVLAVPRPRKFLLTCVIVYASIPTVSTDSERRMGARAHKCRLTPDSTHPGWGLCGLLAAQRMRPLFSGTRNQVADLYRYAAEEAWPPYRPAWLTAHPQIARELGPRAGRLLSIRDLTKYHLPTMSQLRMYSAPPTTIRDLLKRTQILHVPRRNKES
jgi:hypothetical protein